ncbi:MAG: hypothetical protein Q9161_002161 [Pseudevernia consocians]
MSRLAKKHPLSLGETITLFFNRYNVPPHIIADLILWKTKQDLLPEQYNSSYQQDVVNDAKDWFSLQDPVWEWNESNIGTYIAKDQEDYQTIFDAVKIDEDRLRVHRSSGHLERLYDVNARAWKNKISWFAISGVIKNIEAAGTIREEQKVALKLRFEQEISPDDKRWAEKNGVWCDVDQLT